jgi:hypothetical protein
MTQMTTQTNEAIRFPLSGRNDALKRERLLTLFKMIEAAYDEGRIELSYDPAQATVRFTLPREGSQRMRRAYAAGVSVLDINVPNGLLRTPPAEPHLVW